MRKLVPVAALAALAAVPTALASTGSQAEPPKAPLIPKPFRASSLPKEAHRAEKRARRHAAKAKAKQLPPQLQAVAQCESHGDPHAVGGGGQFRGKYQFTFSTWRSVGGHGDPATAPEAEQDRRAAMLLARSGTGEWPVCGS